MLDIFFMCVYVWFFLCIQGLFEKLSHKNKVSTRYSPRGNILQFLIKLEKLIQTSILISVQIKPM